MKSFHALVFLASSISIHAQTPAAIPSGEFSRQQISTHFWAEGAAFGDFNKDGKMDVAYGPYWWAGPEFSKRHTYSDDPKTSQFKKADGTTENRIATWNGSAWSKVANGMNGDVHALTTFSGALYAGGAFTKVGSTTGFNRIAKWNGSAWSKLGSGVGGISAVYALAGFNGDLIVGGQFATTGGGVVTPGIARWSGSAWAGLGSGLNNTVMSLATFDDHSGTGTELYVGGYFTAPVGGAANSAVQIARWNGAWSAVGNGMVVTQPSDSMPRAVFALCDYHAPSPSGDLLYAGGFCEVFPHTAGIAGYLMGYHFVPDP